MILNFSIDPLTQHVVQAAVRVLSNVYRQSPQHPGTVVPRLEVIARASRSQPGPHATNFERTTSTVLNLL